jgi:type I restriction enzyme S subunit
MNKDPLAIEEASSSYQLTADNSGLRKGYKQTEVGVIPEDWDVRSVGEICKVNQGLQIAITSRLKNPSPN